jgi:hypothetical protein
MFEWAIIAAQACIILWFAARIWYLKRKLQAVRLLETTLQGFTERVLEASIAERRERLQSADPLDANHLDF